MAKYKKLQDAVAHVLQKHSGTAMRAIPIWDEIFRDGLWEGNAVVPSKGVITCLLAGVKGDNPRYERVSLGLYCPNLSYNPKKDNAEQPEESETSDESRLIQSFGMYWDRIAWEAKNSPKLLGHQGDGKMVDFGDQRGIYILYHFSTVVYVGRTDRGIGIRLNEHTKDRLKSRWNQFSWFGIRKLKDGSDKEFVPFSDKQPAEDAIISDLEALLIEFAGPPENRKRGDAMEKNEYFQA
ncbi:MAG: GIY-YIG nuclease family protein [Gammaproteobacteria bacterium]